MRLQNAIYKDLKVQQSFHTGARSSATLHYVDLIWKQQETFSPTVVIKSKLEVLQKKEKKNAFCCRLFFHAQLHGLFISLIKLSQNINSDWKCGFVGLYWEMCTAAPQGFTEVIAQPANLKKNLRRRSDSMYRVTHTTLFLHTSNTPSCPDA